MSYEEAERALDYAIKVFFMNRWTQERQDAYDKAWSDFRLAAEAVLGGNTCQSSEHAVPETTPKGEQRS